MAKFLRLRWTLALVAASLPLILLQPVGFSQQLGQPAGQLPGARLAPVVLVVGERARASSCLSLQAIAPRWRSLRRRLRWKLQASRARAIFPPLLLSPQVSRARWLSRAWLLRPGAWAEASG